MAELLQAAGLSKHYGSTVALDSVDFAVPSGITGLLGPNGAGKSTAIKLFLGLLEPTGGQALVMGEEPYSLPAARSRLGYMPEHDCLPSAITASEFLTHMARVSGLPAADARTRAADTLRHVGLDEERYRSIGEYSTGMKQRVKLAQAIVHDPVMVFLDEPTAGLDPMGREEMLDLIRRIGTDFGISALVSTHLMGDVERTCDEILVIDAGRVTHQGAVKGFTEETQTMYIEVDDRRDQLVAALADRGIEANGDGHGPLLIENLSDDGFDAIRDALVASGAPLRRLAPGRAQLSDIFKASGTERESGMSNGQ
jgi:ABC-2 type transport system ATP-binding protein